MSRRLPLILLLIVLPLWLAASYGVRYGLMEDGQWVGICVDEALRSALALYNTSLAVFAVVIAGLRLVRSA